MLHHHITEEAKQFHAAYEWLIQAEKLWDMLVAHNAPKSVLRSTVNGWCEKLAIVNGMLADGTIELMRKELPVYARIKAKFAELPAPQELND